MTYPEALKKHLATLTSLPWETSPEQATVHFHAGWEAHREALKQADLFPGTLSGDLCPVSSTGERRPCNAETRVQLATGADSSSRQNPALHADTGLTPANAGITAEEIYAAWPVKKARGAAIAAIKKAMKKEKPEELLSAVKELAEAFKAWPANERQYLPMCSTFMNQERWADDRTTWRKGSSRVAKFGGAF